MMHSEGYRAATAQWRRWLAPGGGGVTPRRFGSRLGKGRLPRRIGLPPRPSRTHHCLPGVSDALGETTGRKTRRAPAGSGARAARRAPYTRARSRSGNRAADRQPFVREVPRLPHPEEQNRQRRRRAESDAHQPEASRGTRRPEATRDAPTVNVVTDGAGGGMKRRMMSFSGGGGTTRSKCQAGAIPPPRSSRRAAPTRKSVSRPYFMCLSPATASAAAVTVGKKSSGMEMKSAAAVACQGSRMSG